MRNKQLLSLLALALLISSCAKKQTTMVSGHVYNYFTGKPASHMKVMLVSEDKPACYNGVSHIYTDANGYFELSYEGKDKMAFVKADEFGAYRDYTVGDSSNAKTIVSGASNNVTLYATEPCSIEVVLNNVHPFNSSDLVHFWCYYPLPQNDFLGMQANTHVYLPSQAMTNDMVQYSVKKNNIETVYSVHVQVDPYRGNKLVVNY